jgi:hypothetical protein
MAVFEINLSKGSAENRPFGNLVVPFMDGRYTFAVELELTALRFDNPHDAVNGTYGGQGKAVVVTPSAALLCLNCFPKTVRFEQRSPGGRTPGPPPALR